MYFDILPSGKISTCFAATMDSSVNRQALDKHFAAHPARWNTAFHFLSQFTAPDSDKEQLLHNLHRGRTDLSADVYVNVEDYLPKPVEQCRYEAHRRYIDIQYVAQGSEYIALTHDTTLPVLIPYDTTKDITFYQYHPEQLLLADPTKYFIFFPTDLHAPSIQPTPARGDVTGNVTSNVADTTNNVTKVVVKILL